MPFVSVVDYLTRYGIIFPGGGPHIHTEELSLVNSRPGLKEYFVQFQKLLEDYNYGDGNIGVDLPGPYNTAYGYIENGEIFIFCTIRYEQREAHEIARNWYLHGVEPDENYL